MNKAQVIVWTCGVSDVGLYPHRSNLTVRAEDKSNPYECLSIMHDLRDFDVRPNLLIEMIESLTECIKSEWG